MIENFKNKIIQGDCIFKYINADEILFSYDKKYTAKVLANGTIVSDGVAGSIHSVSAHLIGKTNNNGWTFWYVIRDNKLISINEIRNEYRKREMNV